MSVERLDLQKYRFYNDNGALGVATAQAALNTQASLSVNSRTRLRVGCRSEDAAAGRVFLEHRINGGAWTLTTLNTAVRLVASDYFADGAATAQVITTGTFGGGEAVETARNTASVTYVTTRDYEWEFSLYLGVGLAVGDVVEFRLRETISSTHGATGGLVVATVTPSVLISAMIGVSTMLRGTAIEMVQLGAETTPGTAVAAGKRLLCTDFMPSPRRNNRTYRPSGSKFNTASSVGKSFSEVTIEGIWSFHDLCYLLNGLLLNVSPTTPTSLGLFQVNRGTHTGGNFTLTFNGQTTATIAYNAAAAAVQSALEALTTIGAGNVAVTGTGSVADPWVVTFQNGLSGTGLALTGTFAGLTGGSGGAVVIPTITDTRRWTWLMDPFNPDTVKTFTMEKGSTAGAQRCAFLTMEGLTFSFTESEANLSGSAFARKPEHPPTFSAMSAATNVSEVPVDPECVSFYVGDTLLGLKRAGRVLSAEVGVNNRHAPKMTGDCTVTSFTDIVPLAADLTFNLTTELDTGSFPSATTLITRLEAGDTVFLRCEALGPVIEGSYRNRLQMTMPARLMNDPVSDEDGVYAVTFEAQGIYSATLGSALQVIIDNNLTGL